MALEQVALAVRRGGIQEGERDRTATRIASALVAAMPVGRGLEWVRAQVRPLLVLACGEPWVGGEWERSGADASIMGNYLAACRGEAGRSGHKDPRYAYGKARLVEEWEPTRDEIRDLRLRSLCCPADRAWLERQLARQAKGKGDASYDEDILRSRCLAPRVHLLRAEHMTWRAIAAAVGAPVTTVQRLGKLTTDQVAAVVDYLEREQAAEIAEEMARAYQQGANDNGTLSAADAEQAVIELVMRPRPGGHRRPRPPDRPAA